MKFLFIIITMLASAVICRGQDVFTQQQLFDVIKAYHPVAKQAGLRVEEARAGITVARGAFDPLVQSAISRKEFKDVLYYNHQVHQLNIPTWFGVDLTAGIETLSGDRTNPEDTKGSSSYLGFTVPLAKGLLMDGRRAALRQARIAEQASYEERRAMLNTLLRDGAEAYWNWWQRHQFFNLYKAALQNAEERFRLTKVAYEIGERPAIDTLEALTQLQSFRISQVEAAMEVTNARLELSMFLWEQNNTPYELPQTIVPDSAMLAANIDLLLANTSVANHPELRQYDFKIDGLEVERRLKLQSLLPYITFKYNALTGSHRVNEAVKSPFFENNYRYGVNVALPLRLSEGRGGYRQAQIKLQQAGLERTNKLMQLQTKIRQYQNEWRQLGNQAQLQQVAVSQYATLQRAEELRYVNGESSLFLINSRELKTLEARQKAVELKAKQQKAEVGIGWAAGVLAN